MIKKTITYTDYNGEKQTEDFYFNLNKAELAELEFGEEGGFASYIQKVIDSNSGKDIIANFKRIIGLAYGQRTEDGRRFVKSEVLKEEFFQSEAYSELFAELVTDGDQAAKFVSGLVPADLLDQAEAAEKSEEPKGEAPKLPKDMSREELMKAFMEKNQAQLGQGYTK